jgi:hypothetical protein
MVKVNELQVSVLGQEEKGTDAQLSYKETDKKAHQFKIDRGQRIGAPAAWWVKSTLLGICVGNEGLANVQIWRGFVPGLHDGRVWRA